MTVFPRSRGATNLLVFGKHLPEWKASGVEVVKLGTKPNDINKIAKTKVCALRNKILKLKCLFRKN